MKESKKKSDRRAEDSPVAWFAVLERARQADDFETASEARLELKRLGVNVKYTTKAKAVRRGH